MHRVRLLRMACEILSGEGVIVRRPEAAELLAIRRGEWSDERVIEESERLESRTEALERTCALPRAADSASLDATCMALIEAAAPPASVSIGS